MKFKAKKRGAYDFNFWRKVELNPDSIYHATNGLCVKNIDLNPHTYIDVFEFANGHTIVYDWKHFAPDNNVKNIME